MARTDTLELLGSLIDNLTPLGQKSPGQTLRSADWNSLVDAMRTLAQLAASRERTTDEFLDDRYARTDHEHIGQIALTWFEPHTQALLEESVNGAVEQRNNLKAANDEIVRLRGVIDDLQRQFTAFRVQVSGLEDSDSARARDLDKVALRVESLRDVETRVSGLDQRLTSISTNVDAALAFRNELVDEAGQPINVRSFAQRITDLETMRDSLRTADGNLVRIRDVESAIARLEQNAIQRGDVDDVVIGRLRNPDVLAQAGIIDAVRNQVNATFTDRFTGIDQTTTQLTQDLSGIRDSLTSHDTRISQQTTRLDAAEGRIDALAVVPDRLNQQQTQLTDMESRLQGVQTAMADVSSIRLRMDQLSADVDALSPVRTTVDQLAGRMTAVEAQAAAIDGLVTTTQQTSTRVSTIEQQLPALRQAADLVTQQGTVLSQINTRLTAAESQLDNLAAIPSRVDALASQFQQIPALSQRMDDITSRVANVDAVTQRLTAVEQAVADQRLTIARVSDNVTTVRAGLSSVNANIGNLSQTLGTRLTALEGRFG